MVKPYRVEPSGPLAGGIDDARPETQLAKGQTPRAINIDFDRSSAKASRGSIPFNRQVAPTSSVRVRPDPALSPLYIAPNKAVPLHGHLYFPYVADFDIGGSLTMEGDAITGTDRYYNRRGRLEWERKLSVRIPEEEKLYETETRGDAAPLVGAEAAGFTGYSFDEAEDECCIVAHKGGDRAPMSWALGIVNIGRGLGLTNLPPTRVSNYAFVFMWLDSMGWGITDQSKCRYNLTTAQNPNGGAAAQNPSQAYRAILIHKYLEPGRTYHIAWQLSQDTGTPGAAAVNTDWHQDGFFKVFISEDGAAPTTHSAVQNGLAVTRTGLEVYKGPLDSAEYMLKYGIRYQGPDGEFLGGGQRFLPWMTTGFMPLGQDAVALKNGGFQMADLSSADLTALVANFTDFYSIGQHTLTAQHVGVETTLRMNHRGLVLGNTNGGSMLWSTDAWTGFGAGNATWIQPNALRNYKLVTTANMATASQRGARIPIGVYTEDAPGGPYRLEVGAGGMAAWSANVAIIAFRWHQRAIDVGDYRMYSAPRSYESGVPALVARRRMSLRMTLELDDTTEPDLDTLVFYYPLNDSGGTVVKEKLIGGVRNGFFAPFGLGVTDGGQRGKNLVFLSGEGEAPCFDLSQNPIYQREVRNMLCGASQGFALELSCVFPEAVYAIPEAVDLPDAGAAAPLAGIRPRFAPDILSWEVRNPLDSGMAVTPKAILRLTYRAQIPVPIANPGPCLFPMAPSLEVTHASDQQDFLEITPSDVAPWYFNGPALATPRYDIHAPWVGKHVTIQVGVQSTGVVDEYDVYIAMSPKDAFKPASGDPGDAEFAFWTSGAGTTYQAAYAGYFTAAHLKIAPKDLARSVVTIGRFDCGSLGYTELQPRILVDELRVYGSSASGSLPLTNGGIVTGRNGKLEGTNCLAPRELEDAEILQPVGPGFALANVVDGSNRVTPPGSAKFFTADARNALQACRHTYLYVPGDRHDTLAENTLGTEQEEFYFVRDVDNSPPLSLGNAGRAMTLDTAFADASRNGAAAYSLRLLAYTSFADDIRDKKLTLGPGRAFEPGVTTVRDVILTDVFWENRAPVTGGCRLRLYWPGGRIALRDLLPKWVRGLSTPRTNPILGLIPHDGAIYGAAKGVLFEADDRWRVDGPTDDLKYSLAFRSRELDSGVTVGLQQDRVRFDVAQVVLLSPSATDAYATIYDAWVNLDVCSEYQTVLWVGDPTTNPQALAGTSTSSHKIHLAFRFTRGRPEIAFGSTAFYTGTTQPEKGLFIATAANPVAHEKWIHVRWYVYTRANGTIIKQPFCKIQGKPVGVTLNARDNNAAITLSDDWLMAASVVNPGNGSRAFMGIARDSYRAPLANIPFSQNALGTNLMPQRHTGYLHSLCGRIAELMVTQQPMWEGSAPPDFNPYTLSYEVPGINIRMAALADAMGVGHGVHEDAEDQTGVIVSHPCISLYHELEDLDEPVSFADFGAAVYATNGGQPARIQQGLSGLAGVLPPTVAPAFRVERFTLWKPNRRTGFTDTTQDPVEQAVVGAAQQIDHFDNHQNNYLQQVQVDPAGETEISWINVPGAPNTYRWMGFKGLQRLRDITGRRVWWGRKPNQKAGGFFTECRDGKLTLGWYDLYLKQEVSISTDAPVCPPGAWIYWNVRKRWPQNDVNVDGSVNEGNWENEFWANGKGRRLTMTVPAGAFVVGETITGSVSGTGFVTKVYGTASLVVEFVLTSALEVIGNVVGGTSGATGAVASTTRPMKDKALVRVFDLATPAAGSEFPLAAKISPLLSSRNCISFTTGATPRPAGTTATGQVSLPGLRYTGGAGGLVVAPAGTAPFHGDMLGMFFQWGTVGGGAAAFVGQLFKITGFGGAVGNGFAQANVVSAGTAIAPNFVGVAVATEAAVFSGVALQRSPNFDASRMPDDQTYPVYAFGHPDAVIAETGIAPYDGEFDSFGWTSIDDTDGTGARIFENVDSSMAGTPFLDPVLIGTDNFDNDIFGSSAAGPGRCHFDDWAAGPPHVGTFYCINGRDYAGFLPTTKTQPNTDLKLLPDAGGAAANDGPLPSAKAGPCIWQYHQPASTFAAIRYARAAFFDIDQNQVSDPGPEVLIRPDAEDGQNPSGNVRYVLSDLPSPRQSGNFELWIYLGLAGGSSTTLFRVAFVPDLTREVAVMMPEAKIGKFPLLSFSNGAPPRCRFVAAAQARLFYGALESDPVAIVYSNVGFPVAIDYRRFATRFTDGTGDKLTMMRPLDGYLVVAKERAIGGGAIDANGVMKIDMISEEGCVAFQSARSLGGRLFYLAPQGWMIVRRVDQTTLAFPKYISEKIEVFATEKLDRRYLSRVSAAINRRRNQYLFTAREIGSKHTNVRYGIEFDASQIETPVDLTEASGFRFSRYEGPNVVCLATVPSPDGGVERLIGGTEEGLILWMDRADSQLQAAGEDITTWGYSRGHCNSNSRTDSIALVEPGGVDADLDGPRGVPIRYIAQDGKERVVTCLGGDGSILHFDEIVDLGCPLTNDVALGAMVHVYETPWSHLSLPNYIKTITHLDLECSKERFGEIQVQLFVDFDRDDVRATSLLKLAEAKKRCEEFAGIDAIWAKAVVSTPPLAVGTKFEVTQLLWAVTDTDRT